MKKPKRTWLMMLLSLSFLFFYNSTYAQDEISEIESEAFFSLGLDYFFGANGKPKNWKKATSFYKKAASATEGDHRVKAMFNLAIIYERGGNGIKKNSTESKKWYTKACNAGDNDACDMLKRIN